MFAVLILISVGIIEIIGSIFDIFNYLTGKYDLLELRNETLLKIIGAIDYFLISAIFIIFAIGIYILFVGDQRFTAMIQSIHALNVRNLDELKGKIAKVVIMVLIFAFFRAALYMNYSTPFDLLYLGLGIFFIGAALYLTHRE